MSTELDDEIKRWTAKRKSALVLEILQGKKSISEASRLHDVTPDRDSFFVYVVYFTFDKFLYTLQYIT